MGLGFSSDIIEILDYIGKKFGIVIDWSANSVMPYLKELATKFITYKITVSYMWIIAMLVIVVVGIGFCIYSHFKKDGSFAFIGWVGIIIACCIIVFNVYIVIECKTFPEKVIFEYIKGIYDNGSWK